VKFPVILSAIATSLLLSVSAQDFVERLQLTVGQIEEVQLPFEASGISIGQPGIVEARLVPPKILMVTGSKKGSTGIIVKGRGIASKQFEVIVVHDNSSLLRSISEDLEVVPEVEVSQGHAGRVKLRGTISDPERYNRFVEVKAAYGNDVLSLVEFQPADEIMVRLGESIKHGGFRLSEAPRGLLRPGDINLRTDGTTISITGKVYSRAEYERILALISSQRWIVQQVKDEQGGTKAMPGQVNAYVDIEIEESTIELDVRLLSVDSDRLQLEGFNALRRLQFDARSVFGQAYGNIGNFNRLGNQAGNYLLNAELDDTFNLIDSFNDRNIENKIDLGAHLMFRSGEQENAVMSSGKTFLIQPRVGFGGTAGDFQTIETGVNIQAKGRRVDASTVSIDFSVSLKSAQDPGGAAFVTQDEFLRSTNVRIPFGKTLVLTGKNEYQIGNIADGVPKLKRNKILRFFTSDNSKDTFLSRFVILVSPRIPNDMLQTMPVRAETLPLTRSVLANPPAVRPAVRPAVNPRSSTSTTPRLVPRTQPKGPFSLFRKRLNVPAAAATPARATRVPSTPSVVRNPPSIRSSATVLPKATVRSIPVSAAPQPSPTMSRTRFISTNATPANLSPSGLPMAKTYPMPAR